MFALNALSVIFKILSLVNLKRKALRRQKFPALIVSIDNLSFGGTGKTTLVTELGKKLAEKGIKFAVVTRGYKSAFEHDGVKVQPHHKVPDVGDEAAIYKKHFPLQDIYVGKDRRESINRAVRDNNKIILLDDGFQSTHIHRDIKIMLLNPLHPYYYLRNFKFTAAKENFILNYRDGYDFEFAGFYDTRGKPVETGDFFLYGFSALGDNARFENDLSAFNLAGFSGFKDHHQYSQSDLERLNEQRIRAAAAYLVCTEKDFVKLIDINFQDIPLIFSRNSIKLTVDLTEYVLNYARKENYI
ncbi:MAG: tetraacyldisaccharide 4'-kinase [bacterium]|nr:tetraacyldisaccharide 4'-kinase [bacterium]